LNFDKYFLNIDKNNSVQNVFINLFNDISNDNLNEYKCKLLFELIEYIKSSQILKYNTHLVKIVNTLSSGVNKILKIRRKKTIRTRRRRKKTIRRTIRRKKTIRRRKTIRTRRRRKKTIRK
jgi:hypothetical protein